MSETAFCFDPATGTEQKFFYLQRRKIRPDGIEIRGSTTDHRSCHRGAGLHHITPRILIGKRTDFYTWGQKIRFDQAFHSRTSAGERWDCNGFSGYISGSHCYDIRTDPWRADGTLPWSLIASSCDDGEARSDYSIDSLHQGVFFYTGIRRDPEREIYHFDMIAVTVGQDPLETCQNVGSIPISGMVQGFYGNNMGIRSNPAPLMLYKAAAGDDSSDVSPMAVVVIRSGLSTNQIMEGNYPVIRLDQVLVKEHSCIDDRDPYPALSWNALFSGSSGAVKSTAALCYAVASRDTLLQGNALGDQHVLTDHADPMMLCHSGDGLSLQFHCKGVDQR